MPDGSESAAKFNVFRWPHKDRPGGMRIFACQHLSRNTVWIPELMSHDNGSTRIIRIEVLAADPARAAKHMSRLIDQPATKESDGCWRVPSGANRADFLFLDPQTFAESYAAEARQGAADEGCVALVLGTDQLDQARTIAGAVASTDQVIIPASHATGVMIVFVPT